MEHYYEPYPRQGAITRLLLGDGYVGTDQHEGTLMKDCVEGKKYRWVFAEERRVQQNEEKERNKSSFLFLETEIERILQYLEGEMVEVFDDSFNNKVVIKRNEMPEISKNFKSVSIKFQDMLKFSSHSASDDHKFKLLKGRYENVLKLKENVF